MIDEPASLDTDYLLKFDIGHMRTIERVILCNDGTVQKLLSIIFHAPIKVDVIDQIERIVDGDTIIERKTHLIADRASSGFPNKDIVVCKAFSTINVSECPEGFINGIRERHFGIGQLLAAIGFRTSRSILSMGTSKDKFVREYSIDSVGVRDPPLHVVIMESFDKSVYEKV